MAHRVDDTEVEEVHCLGQSVFDEHASGVACDERLGGGLVNGGQDHRRAGC